MLAAQTSFEVGPELKVLLYNIMGPTAGLKVGARLEVDRDQQPCYRLFGTVGWTSLMLLLVYLLNTFFLYLYGG